MEYQRAQLKEEVKQKIRITRPRPIWMTLLYLVVMGIGSNILNTALGAVTGASEITNNFVAGMAQQSDMEYLLQYTLGYYGADRIIMALVMGGMLTGLLVSLWQGVMGVNYAGYCLSVVRGEQPGIEGLFGQFYRIGGILVTRFLVVLFETLWSVPFYVGCGLVIILAAVLISFDTAVLLLVGALLLLLAVVGLCAGLIWVNLRYAMVDFLIADQGITGMDAISESKRLMMGNKKKLFVLNLSFWNWYLPAIIGSVVTSFVLGWGIAMKDFITIMLTVLLLLVVAGVQYIISLWLIPYLTGAQARFYEVICGRAAPRRPSWQNPGAQNYSYTWTDSSPNSGQGIGSSGSWSGSSSGGLPGGAGDRSDTKKPPKGDPWDDDPWDQGRGSPTDFD